MLEILLADLVGAMARQREKVWQDWVRGGRVEGGQRASDNRSTF